MPATDAVQYQDDFTKPSSGWPEAKYDNYFIGYHEPDYYHVALQSPNSRTSVFVPGKPSFGDATIEVKVFTDPNNTAAEGDFRYGTIFRRSGDLFYAFVISPRTQKWYVLKSSPDKLEVLKEGTDDSIQGLEAKDTLRVDAKGPTFFFHINDHLVDQVSDADYASGEVGFFVQTFDSTRAHIHFDSITIRDVQSLQPQTAVQYQDDFTKPSSGWPEAKYDNYFIGYHEPDYYHVALQSPNSRTSVFVPGKPSFGDATIEVKVFTDPNNTAAEGDFRYGTIFRRSGDLFYAFVISPRTQKWYVLKSSPDKLEVLKEGTDDSIQGLEAKDTLRVDAKGPTFFFHINDHLVDQVSDADYASGEVGFFVQTFDSTRAHIHFDSITIRDVQVQWICSFLKKALYLRSGPGSSFTPITSLSQGDSMEPLGISPDSGMDPCASGAQ